MKSFRNFKKNLKIKHKMKKQGQKLIDYGIYYNLLNKGIFLETILKFSVR